MKRFVTAGVAILCFAAAQPARAGWIVEFSNVAINARGDRMPAVATTSRIADQKIRADQEKMVMVNDFKEDKYTVMNTERQSFWSGSTTEYQAQTTARKLDGLSKRFRKFKDRKEMPPIDEEKLPRIVIRKTELEQDIAGQKTTKYVIESNAELFQELWLTDQIDMSEDVSIDKQIALWRKSSRDMVGKSSGPFNALYVNEEYRKLLEKRFVMRSTTHHGAGKFERTVTTVRRTDIAPEEFAVPKEYKRVRLSDVQAAQNEASKENVNAVSR